MTAMRQLPHTPVTELHHRDKTHPQTVLKKTFPFLMLLLIGCFVKATTKAVSPDEFSATWCFEEVDRYIPLSVITVQLSWDYFPLIL